MQHIFIVGSKGLGNYGGYETFLERLVFYHQKQIRIKYHIACKANGMGFMDEKKLKGAKIINDTEFIYCNAHCFKIRVPEIGMAQAIYYDVAALKYCCEYIKKNYITHPIIYILSSRVGPFISYYKNKIHSYEGQIWQNPDGKEYLRSKYSFPVRKYWKISERLMIKNSDLIVCDSKAIENYIQKEYKAYHPDTRYIAYGAELRKSILADNDDGYWRWMSKFKISNKEYYLVVGRFVPENNFEKIICEFMKSHSKKDLVLVTNVNNIFLKKLEDKLHFSMDQRIKFVGTVYDRQLLMKIRENAYAYLHGHEVGGTNPSLLEALVSTSLNLLLDVEFNKEVAEDSALYWEKQDGNLAELIDKVDNMEQKEIGKLGDKAKERIKIAYSWDFIVNKYEQLIGFN